MRTGGRLLLCGALVLTLAACTPWVKTEFNPQADFSALQTFAWAAPQRQSVENPILDSALLDSKVQDAVTATLRTRGFAPAPPDSADFIVTYHAAKDLASRPADWSMGVGFGGPWWGYSYPWQNTIIVSRSPEYYEEGVLIIDILDARNGALLWRGWRSKYLSQKNFTPEAVQATVAEILAEFPPGADSNTG